MKTAFDHTAIGYDAEFTHTPIGKLQRESVWSYLRRSFGAHFPASVLELNCGTGEDAIFLANHGSKVLATDVSEKMLEVTNEKINSNQLSHGITTKQLDITDLTGASFDIKFDLVFSNFGGLNCVNASDLTQLFNTMPVHMNIGGRMILVIMPRFCAWESLYYLSGFHVKEAFRRRRKTAQSAGLGNSQINVWYHDPSDIVNMSSRYFKIKHIQPVGIAVPPSYFKKTFINNRYILKNLGLAERKLNKFKSLSRLADHYLIDLELK